MGPAPTEPVNKAGGKSFTGSRGGGRYTNVQQEDVPGSDAMPMSPGPAAREGNNIQLDMWDDGRFEYTFVQNKDGQPDGPEVLQLFLAELFGTAKQKAFRGDDIVERLGNQLAESGIHTMKQIRATTKRELDELGIGVGPRAMLVDRSKEWTPPNWDDTSFALKGKWSAEQNGAVVSITFSAETETMAAYDNVEVPSSTTFSLDGAFMASGQCRGLNGNCPGPVEPQRAFLAYQTDMLEEAEVSHVRQRKELMREMLGGKLHEMSVLSEWVLSEYRDKKAPLLQEGWCYASIEAVQRSEDKLVALKSCVDQALATFEDYYGASERLSSLPSMDEMNATEEADKAEAKKKADEKAALAR